jgi:dihydrofolate reductase
MLSVTSFVSLDGVMQAPGGPSEDPSGGFDQGGWLVPYFDADLGSFIGGVFERADAFLLGRRTYEIFAGHWPRVTDPNNLIASKLNALPKHVVSSTLSHVEWNNSSLVGKNVVDEIRALGERYPRELQVHGSSGLLQTLLQHRLIDELHLLVFPVVLGKGKRLFGPGAVPAAMSLVACKTSSTGTIICTYRPAGEPKYGSFELPRPDRAV